MIGYCVKTADLLACPNNPFKYIFAGPGCCSVCTSQQQHEHLIRLKQDKHSRNWLSEIVASHYVLLKVSIPLYCQCLLKILYKHCVLNILRLFAKDVAEKCLHWWMVFTLNNLLRPSNVNNQDANLKEITWSGSSEVFLACLNLFINCKSVNEIELWK